MNILKELLTLKVIIMKTVCIFLRYSEIPDAVTKSRSSATNSYFKSGLFSTGYATHSLFPYHGKFHPQLIKGLINVLGLKKGETILLAFLDALGYSKRVVRSNHEQLFTKVLTRYIETVKSFLNNKYFDNSSMGKLEILENSDALNIQLEDNSIDGIITSPPYSFAIDYVENDKDQLEFLGYDTNDLKHKLIGLKGKTKKEKLEIYFNDMDKFCYEAARVLKKNKYLVIIIGSNTNQTGGIRLEKTVINSAKKYGLLLVKSILKQIKGMRNTMKEEYVLIFEKN